MSVGLLPASVYPRWRGEHSPAARLNAFAHGLSPLARGTLIFSTFIFKSIRFIPAGAGNTKKFRDLTRIKTVYPRWRGEHTKKCTNYNLKAGLSPLARGTPFSKSRSLDSSRFIPAGAGNTPVGGTLTIRMTVYPRWRGEHFFS